MSIGAVLRALGEALDAAEIPWMVAGSVASSVWGEVRSKQDIDIVALATRDRLEGRHPFFLAGAAGPCVQTGAPRARPPIRPRSGLANPAAWVGRAGIAWLQCLVPSSINLADPDFEPSDDELKGLMQRAFAGVREARERSLVEMRARIARLERESLARYAGRDGPNTA